jgi:hypothetical protein
MLALSDDELGIVMTAAKPLQPRDRGAFLADVASELSKYEVVGVGIIGRVVAKVQREHLAPRTGHNVGSRYSHW